MGFFGILFSGIGKGFSEIGSAFVTNLSIWWVLLPIFLLWIVLEVYFGEYKKERLGWNTALANGISFSWIVIDSVRHLFSTHPKSMWLRFLILFVLLSYSVFITVISFAHKFSPKVTYALAAPTPVYFLCMVTILWSYGELVVDGWTILSLSILFGFAMLLFYLLRKFLPERESKDSEF